MIDFDEVLASNSTRFRDVLAEVAQASPVPSCPEWTADDLVGHLTEVQNFWGTIVAEGLQSDEQVGAVAAPERAAGRDDALLQFGAVSSRLRAALAAAHDDAPAWTWTPDHTIGWIRRRQAQEALMHRVDAELTAGLPVEIDQDVAEDGVDELLTQFGAALPEWGAFNPSGLLIEVRSTSSGRSWWVRLGRFGGVDPSGRGHDEPDFQPVDAPGGPADAVLEGAAPELLRWLWGRGADDGVRSDGAPDARAVLREALLANTQ